MSIFPEFKDIRRSISVKPKAEIEVESEFPLLPGDDEKFMARALQLARKGIYTSHPNPVVGCVVVKNGRIVGEGWHQRAGEGHAEVNALNDAGKSADGATMYVTLEPCSHHGKTPPCTNAIIKAQIARVVIATEDPNPLVNRSGISELQRAGIEVYAGVGQIQAKRINRGFLKRITTGFPWVTMKIAISLDGKTAMATGESQWITSEPARNDAQKLRAAASAILTGVGTILRDNPSMNARMPGVSRQPHRVILDSNLSTPPNASIFNNDGDVLIITANVDDDAKEMFSDKAVEIVSCPVIAGKVNLTEVMLELGRREINTVLLEAGAILSGGMLANRLVDEIVIYMAPDLLGDGARGMFRVPGLEKLSDKLTLEFEDIVMVGRDVRLTLSPQRLE